MVRLQISLSRTEANALARWAASELRDPRDQIRFMLRRELERLGLIQPTNVVGEDQPQDQEVNCERTLT